MRDRKGRDFESTYLAMRRRMNTLGTAVIPAPVTIAAHRHHASEIDFTPNDTTGGLLSADDVQEALEEHDTEKLARSGVQPMLGNLNMNTFYIYDIGQLRFDQDTVTAHVDGGLTWADDSGIERLVMTAAGASGNVDMPLGGVYVKVLNETGAEIAARKPVYLSGADGATNLLNATLDADNVSINDNQRGGLTMQSIANGAKGWVCIHGYAGGLDFSEFVEGDQLYVGGSPGDLSTTPPLKGCGFRIRIGTVIAAANPGSMWVDVDRRPDLDDLSNVSTGDFVEPKQHYDVPMWLPTPLETGCDAWRDVPANRFPTRIVVDTDTQLSPKDVIIHVTADTQPVVITLATLDGTDGYANALVRVKKIAGAERVTIDAAGTESIEGQLTVDLIKVGEVLDLQAVGNDWVIL